MTIVPLTKYSQARRSSLFPKNTPTCHFRTPRRVETACCPRRPTKNQAVDASLHRRQACRWHTRTHPTHSHVLATCRNPSDQACFRRACSKRALRRMSECSSWWPPIECSSCSPSCCWRSKCRTLRGESEFFFFLAANTREPGWHVTCTYDVMCPAVVLVRMRLTHATHQCWRRWTRKSAIESSRCLKRVTSPTGDQTHLATLESCCSAGARRCRFENYKTMIGENKAKTRLYVHRSVHQSAAGHQQKSQHHENFPISPSAPQPMSTSIEIVCHLPTGGQCNFVLPSKMWSLDQGTFLCCVSLR